jgi:SAM-dependent methyltransferase
LSILPYNKVCEFEDFADPNLIALIRDIFPHEMSHFSPDFPRSAEYRKYWEVAMAVRTFKDLGAMTSDAIVLGVGAGTETTLFYLANHVRQVFATDLYLQTGVWSEAAPSFMLFEPEAVAPYAFDKRRLVVQHMDGRFLRYPDDTFDGVFSSSSVEHFGSLDSIASAVYEMGRVLKPGGILTLSTEFYLTQPHAARGPNIGNVQLFTIPDLEKYIIAASGLELIDLLQTGVSAKTMESRRPLDFYLKEIRQQVKAHGRYPRVGEVVWSTYPHIVLESQGHEFTSVHIAMRKAGTPWGSVNGWARPDYEAIAAGGRVEESQPVQAGRSMPYRLLRSIVPLPARKQIRRLLGANRGSAHRN